MRAKAWLLAVVLLAATGCGKESVSFPFEEVRYTLSGGVAGFDRVLSVRPDGSYEIMDDGRSVRRGRLPGEHLRALKERLAAVDWLDLQPEYSDPKVADALFETVIVRTEMQKHETTVGTGGTPPAELSDLLVFLADRARELRT